MVVAPFPAVTSGSRSQLATPPVFISKHPVIDNGDSFPSLRSNANLGVTRGVLSILPSLNTPPGTLLGNIGDSSLPLDSQGNPFQLFDQHCAHLTPRGCLSDSLRPCGFTGQAGLGQTMWASTHTVIGRSSKQALPNGKMNGTNNILPNFKLHRVGLSTGTRSWKSDGTDLLRMCAGPATVLPTSLSAWMLLTLRVSPPVTPSPRSAHQDLGVVVMFGYNTQAT